MTKQAVLYARVSTEEQTKRDAVSIDSQLSDMEKLCQGNGWKIAQTFVDCENYRATHTPKRGKIVSPSGERADRPQFLEMLEFIKSGAADIVLCWRDDRLMRHPRVAVALEDALDAGDVARNGQGKIAIKEATGGDIDRFTLNIKAVIWREENKRRVERTKMGKLGTLKLGRWPGNYERYGYTSKKEDSKRGRTILLGDPDEVEMVKNIYDWYDSGLPVSKIRQRLIKRGIEQSGLRAKKHDWGTTMIYRMLRTEDYSGVARWNFQDGTLSLAFW
jgi:DNA invertase Pin-like site-specific DNA recombinase